jgi:hypothetical protein
MIRLTDANSRDRINIPGHSGDRAVMRTDAPPGQHRCCRGSARISSTGAGAPLPSSAGIAGTNRLFARQYSVPRAEL